MLVTLLALIFAQSLVKEALPAEEVLAFHLDYLAVDGLSFSASPSYALCLGSTLTWPLPKYI